MDENTYFQERLEGEIAWYERKSSINKRNYYLVRLIEFLSAALIPFLINFLSNNTEMLKLAVEVLGIIVVISTSVISLFRFQELWTEYRTNAESLKHEKYLYLSSAPPYDSPDKFKTLVERVERLISSENSRWQEFTGARN